MKKAIKPQPFSEKPSLIKITITPAYASLLVNAGATDETLWLSQQKEETKEDTPSPTP